MVTGGVCGGGRVSVVTEGVCGDGRVSGDWRSSALT